MKIDPYQHQLKYEKWKRSTAKGIPGISKANSDLIKQYLKDMELGMNVSVSSPKGPRSYIRLNTLRYKMLTLVRMLDHHYGYDEVTAVTEEHLHQFFVLLSTGRITKADGTTYKSSGDYVQVFKAFWHWHMLVQRKRSIDVPDITAYLDARRDKPAWVYLTEGDVKKLCNNALFHYRVLMLFMFDSGIRSPTELINIRVGDLYDGYTKLNIREETSKTFGRKINLLLCPALLREYIREKGLAPGDQLFSISPPVVNRYLKRLATRVLGHGVSMGGEKHSNLTMYDFRHSSACYWLPRYKSESALMYRFGWKKSDEIHYYTQLLGMRDNITEDDLLHQANKTELEKRLDQSERDKTLLTEQVVSLQQQMSVIKDAVAEILGTVKSSRRTGLV